MEGDGRIGWIFAWSFFLAGWREGREQFGVGKMRILELLRCDRKRYWVHDGLSMDLQSLCSSQREGTMSPGLLGEDGFVVCLASQLVRFGRGLRWQWESDEFIPFIVERRVFFFDRRGSGVCMILMIYRYHAYVPLRVSSPHLLVPSFQPPLRTWLRPLVNVVHWYLPQSAYLVYFYF